MVAEVDEVEGERVEKEEEVEEEKAISRMQREKIGSVPRVLILIGLGEMLVTNAPPSNRRQLLLMMSDVMESVEDSTNDKKGHLLRQWRWRRMVLMTLGGV